jgi:hypothetical protein
LLGDGEVNLTSSSYFCSRVAAARQHLFLGAVAVVGAGLSIDARFPLTSGLNPLLWDALDADVEARRSVAQNLGRPDSLAKKLVGDNSDDVVSAWEVVGESTIARRRFQHQFSELDSKRSDQPSPAHEALARLVHAGIVVRVVSLNWDTALECAYRRLYGVQLPRGVLAKPHGDASQPEIPWTLPNEPGLVPAEVAAEIRQLKQEHARTLLIIGYSERDRVVVDNLIAPLDDSWRTVRIGPNADRADDMPAAAEVALPSLASDCEKREATAAWHTVTYHGRRDIGAALRGERLSASDVDTCPPLAEVDLLVDALRADHAIVMNGPTGCGKSISAYQALRRLVDEGFETLRLRDHARTWGVRRWLTDLRVFPRPKVLFVDDAQDLSPDTVRELAECADAETLVLVVGIDHVAGGVRTIRMSASAGVARLAKWVRAERGTLFRLVHALDDHVGSHPRDLLFDNRIAVAEREKTLWRFFYTLTGGWRRIRRAALELRDADRADVALLAVAVAQIAGVDAGVDRATLVRLAGVLGRDIKWLDTSLQELTTRRLVLGSDGRLRCAHLHAAFAVLSWMLHPPPWSPAPWTRPQIPPIASAIPKSLRPPIPDPPASPPAAGIDLADSDERTDRDVACKLVTFMLDSADTPLRGLSWLVDCGPFASARDVLCSKQVLSTERYETLAKRALSTSAADDVAAAAQLLAKTIGYARDSAVLQTVMANDDRLREWFTSIAPENAWALGDLVNSLYRPDSDFAAHVAAYSDPERLAALVIDGGWPHSSSTGHALDRLCNVGGKKVRDAIRPHLDYEAYLRMFNTATPEFWRAIDLIADLSSVDHEMALRILSHVGGRLAHQFSADPVLHWNEMFELVIRLGYGPSFSRRRRRHLPEITAAVRAFTGALDQLLMALTLSGPNDQWDQLNFGWFVQLLSEADPSTFTKVAALVDMEAFEESLRASADNPDRTALVVAYYLQSVRADEIHAILDRLEPSLQVLDPYFVYLAPDISLRALRRGLPLDLGLDSQNWELAAAVLDGLFAHDPTIAEEVVRTNADTMAIGLAAANHANPWDGLRNWITACDHAAPGVLDAVIAGLPEGVVLGWDRGLRRPKKYGRSHRKDIVSLVHRAARLNGNVATEAAELLRRFPSVSR